MNRLNTLIQQKRVRHISVGVITVLVLVPIIYAVLFKGGDTIEAGWFNDSWQYRQKIVIDNASGSDATNYQIDLDLDTSTLITAGKLQNDCDDIRVSSVSGELLPHWVEESGAYACNDTDTKIWIKHPSVPSSDAVVYVYYGNESAVSTEDPANVFEFFDDFNDGAISSSLWTQGTVAATTGTDFTESGGYLSGGNNSRYIQSVTAYTGDYAAVTRMQTNVDNPNGFTTVGFWATTTDNFGILDHNNSSYTRSDAGWVGFAFDGTGQWSRNEVKVVGTNANYWRIGETSGSATNTRTNSGISSEYLRMGPRYDNGANDQEFDADWDWIYVRKALSTDLSAGTPATEEVGPGPILVVTFDEGEGATIIDHSGYGKDGTLVSGTFQTEDACVSGKCMFFDGSDDEVTYVQSHDLLPRSNYTVSTWVRPTNDGMIWWVSETQINFGSSTESVSFRHWDGGTPYVISSGNGLVPLNKWTHITATHDSTAGTALYINGQEVGTDATATNQRNANYSFQIGNDEGSTFYDGFVDELKVYPYARSAAEIKSDFISSSSSNGSSAVFGAQDQSYLSDGLVGYWPLDETIVIGASGTLYDSSGNGNNLISNRSSGDYPNTSSGRFGNSVGFPNANQWLAIDDGSQSGLDGTESITVTAWIKPTSSAGCNSNSYIAVAKGLSATNFVDSTQLGYRLTGACNGGSQLNGVQFIVTSDGTDDNEVYSGSSLSMPVLSEEWYHFAGVYDGSTLSAYLNGDLFSSTSYTGGIFDNTSNFRVGGLQYSGGGGLLGDWPGSIDDTRVYNRALSSAEISQLYNWAPGPVAHYKLDDNVSGDAQTVVDTSGNGNNGTTEWGAAGMDCTVRGQYGKGCDFDGSDDYIAVIDPGADSDFDVDSGDTITIALWMNHDALLPGATYESLVGKGNGENYVMQVGPTGGLEFCIYDGTWKCANTDSNVYAANEWTHYTVVYRSGTGVNMYINSIDIPQTGGSLSTDVGNVSNNDLIIGATDASSENFSGLIDDVQIYNYGLDETQIKNVMNGRSVSANANGSPVGSPVMHLNFDEGHGDTAEDSSSHSNDGNLQGTCPGASTCPTWTSSGYISGALDFERSSGQYAVVTDASSVDLTGDEMTISAWINPETVNLDHKIVYKSEDNTKGYSLAIYTNTLEVNVYTDGTCSSTRSSTGKQTLSTDEWIHVMGVYDGSTLQNYINGEKDGSARTCNGSILSAAANLYVGRYDVSNVHHFDGEIDELKIYNYALTQDEINLEFNQGQSVVFGAKGTEADGTPSWSKAREYCVPGSADTCNPPVFEMNFDQQKVTGNSQTIPDVSGNGNDGTTSWGGNASGMQCNQKGVKGNACQFDAVDDVISVASDSAFEDIYDGGGTISAWIYPITAGESSGARIIEHTGTPAGYYVGLQPCDANNFDVYMKVDNSGTDGQWRSDCVVPVNEWSFLTYSYDDDNVANDPSFYLNGKLLSFDLDTNPSAYISNSGSTMYVGNGGTGSNTTDGLLDQISMYDYIRTPAQIAWEFNKGGPVGWWKFDECEGTTINDWASDGNGNYVGNHGTLNVVSGGTYSTPGTCDSGVGSESWNVGGANGVYGSAMVFDGDTGEYVNVGDPADGSLDFGTGDFSIATWVKFPSIGVTEFVVEKGTQGTTGDPGYSIFVASGGQMTMRLQDDSGSRVSRVLGPALNADTWYHVVFTADRDSDVTLYLDGKDVGSSDISSENGSVDTADPFTISRNSAMEGMVDDVRVYNYVLSPEQVKVIMNNDGAVRFD